MNGDLSNKFLESQRQLDKELIDRKLKKDGFIFLSDVMKTLEEERRRWYEKLLNEES